MDAELLALSENHTWDVVDLPHGKTPIGCRWVYKIKHKADGSIERYKAKLVAKGYTQMEGIDYFDTFSPVAKITTVRVLLSLAAVKVTPHLRFKKSSFSLIRNLESRTLVSCIFLGFEIARSPAGIFLNQSKYTLELLEDAGLLAAKPFVVPFNPTAKLSVDDGPVLDDPSSYRRLIGKLIYLTNSQSGISFVVQHLSQYVFNPRVPHYQAATQILRCLKFVLAKVLLFSTTSKLQLFGFADSDWARCPDTRKSIKGYCVMLGSSLLSWKSKKQHTVSRSSIEAEYRALAAVTCELQWLSFLFQDLLVHFDKPASIFCDNKSSIYLAYNCNAC